MEEIMRENNKYVYSFSNGKAEGNASMRDLLGGKGANLAEMTSIGLPVPPGFTIGTNACEYFNGLPAGLEEEVLEAAHLSCMDWRCYFSAFGFR
jgi:pyruvate,orthophosphate dikinase